MDDVRVYSDAVALAAAACDLVVECSRDSIERHGAFRWALSGGTTPERTYRMLAEPESSGAVDWDRVHIYWGDERAVPPDDPTSNFRMANDALLSRVPIPSSHVHRIEAELPPEEAATRYGRLLRDELESGFDLAFLGLGTDGHTASLFPGSPALEETSHRCVAHYEPSVGMWRITVTPRVFNASCTVACLVEGSEKSEIVNRALNPQAESPLLPVQRIRPSRGRMLWLLDSLAGRAVSDLP